MKNFYKISLIVFLSIFSIPITTFASQKSSSQLNSKNLNEINQTIDTVLSSKYESLESLSISNVKNYIKNNELIDLLNNQNTFYIKLSKKLNSKINNYDSKVKIEDISKDSSGKYIALVSYSVEFNLKNSSITSKSLNEKYKLELINENNKWYITKLLDLDDFELTEPKLNTQNSYSVIQNTNPNFDDYQNILDSQLSSIDDMTKNIDKYYNYSKKSSLGNSINFARSYSGYNRQAAIDYAHKYAKGKNPKYKYFDGNDCTNFVSQCVYEGGGIPEGFGWKPALKDSWIDAKAWTCVNEFFDYMVSKGYATAPPDGCKHSNVGDVIQFYNKDKQTFSHAVILTKSNDTGMYYSAHSKARYDYPVWLAFDGTYSNLRLIKFWS
ncbi:MAG: amidase domain-containing protein [Bacilli bacterium]